MPQLSGSRLAALTPPGHLPESAKMATVTTRTNETMTISMRQSLHQLVALIDSLSSCDDARAHVLAVRGRCVKGAWSDWRAHSAAKRGDATIEAARNSAKTRAHNN